MRELYFKTNGATNFFLRWLLLTGLATGSDATRRDAGWMVLMAVCKRTRTHFNQRLKYDYLDCFDARLAAVAGWLARYSWPVGWLAGWLAAEGRTPHLESANRPKRNNTMRHYEGLIEGGEGLVPGPGRGPGRRMEGHYRQPGGSGH